jgi:hypothetical protein
MKKSCSMRTYLQWSTSVHRVLHGERALRELAQIVVYSTKCMGRQKALYVPDAMERRIQRAGGLNGLIRCDEHAKPLEPREFTAFLAKAIETRKNPWPSQKEVQDGTAPMQIIQEFKAWQRQRGLQSPPPRGSSPLSPRAKREPKAEAGPSTSTGTYKEILKRSDDQAPITQFLAPRKRVSEVERVIAEGEERLEAMDPILQDVKQEVQQGAAGRRVLKEGAEDVEMSETETDEEPPKRKRGGAKRKTAAEEEKPLKRRKTQTEDEAPPLKSKKDKKKKKKAGEERTGAEEDRSRSYWRHGSRPTQRPCARAPLRFCAECNGKKSRLDVVGWRGPRASSTISTNIRSSSRWWRGQRRERLSRWKGKSWTGFTSRGAK